MREEGGGDGTKCEFSLSLINGMALSQENSIVSINTGVSCCNQSQRHHSPMVVGFKKKKVTV